MNVNQKYAVLARIVNQSKTEKDHHVSAYYLEAWVDGVLASGGFISEQMANLACADGHPVKMGLWQDWKPEQADLGEYVRALNV
ncbi:MAG: hypothetical protein WC856_02615 [Methylococcaceae bacterium]|jgi:hypothetical protein